MTDSLASWLALREPADVAARSATLAREIIGLLSGRDPLRALDLGTGTGSNVRYLAGSIHVPQRWLLVDRDPTVLAAMPARMAEWGTSRGYTVAADGKEANDLVIHGPHMDCRVETSSADLGRLPDRQIFSGRHLVTASALLDLVSDQWLRDLAGACRESGAVGLFALTYTGRSVCSPAEPEDDDIRGLLNQHQKASDKGFGPAVGPDAFQLAMRSFADVGYEVRCEVSDWRLPPGEKALQRLLIQGWAQAAQEIAPGQARLIDDWQKRRLAHVEATRSHIVVSHQDLAAWPPEGAR